MYISCLLQSCIEATHRKCLDLSFFFPNVLHSSRCDRISSIRVTNLHGTVCSLPPPSSRSTRESPAGSEATHFALALSSYSFLSLRCSVPLVLLLASAVHATAMAG
jgi:hypothetical protein